MGDQIKDGQVQYSNVKTVGTWERYCQRGNWITKKEVKYFDQYRGTKS